MRARHSAPIVLFALITVATIDAWANTITVEDVPCPICGAERQISYFMTMSYNPGFDELQLLSWQDLGIMGIPGCPSCAFSALYGEFEELEEDEATRIREYMGEWEQPWTEETFADVPVEKILLAAEQLYRFRDRDDEFWCRFYRTLGYHLSRAGRDEEAAEVRGKALDLATAMLQDTARDGQRKENLYIVGAMQHLLGDDEQALGNFEEALELTYEPLDEDDRWAADYDEALTVFLEEYIAMLKPGAAAN